MVKLFIKKPVFIWLLFFLIYVVYLTSNDIGRENIFFVTLIFFIAVSNTVGFLYNAKMYWVGVIEPDERLMRLITFMFSLAFLIYGMREFSI